MTLIGKSAIQDEGGGKKRPSKKRGENLTGKGVKGGRGEKKRGHRTSQR